MSGPTRPAARSRARKASTSSRAKRDSGARTKVRQPSRASRARVERTDGLHTALVLQGGAALGAYEAGVLQTLLRKPARPLDIVTGCSVGALMAAIAVGARRDPVATLHEMWRRFAMPVNPFLPNLLARSLPLPGRHNVYRPNPVIFTMPMLATHMYESAALEDAVSEWVDFDRLNGADTEVIVTAVELTSGRLSEFSNRQRLTAKHIVASASLPPVFPATTIDHGAYWDGGLIASTPLRPAINAIERHNQFKRAPVWELAVVDLFAPEPALPRDMTDVLQRTFELVFFGRFQHDLKLFQWMNAQLDLMIEIDRALPRDSPIRNHPAYLKLKRHRRVDRLTVIRPSDPARLSGPADFSMSAIEARMALGRADALRALVR